jgi:hypothetical protein
MQDNPDMLHLGRRSDGSLIAVGLPWNAGVFIQEYWSRRIPWYAVANTSDKTVEIVVREWRGRAGPSLMDAWTIAPGSVQFHEVQRLMGPDAGSLIAVSLDANPVFGLLKAPRISAFPAEWTNLDDILTVDGLNGLGDRNTDLLCRQEGLVFHSLQVASLELRIPGDLDTIVFGEAPPSGSLPQALIKSAVSKTLLGRAGGDHIAMESLEHSTVAFHKVALTIELPETAVETMGVLLGRVKFRNGAGFSFARGLTIHPRME